MSDSMAEIRASFFVECEELLEALHDGLQAIEDGMSDDETVNMVFRSVHSIKGGAGAFGLDSLVAFAHMFETALDEVRSGNLAAEGDTLKLFFQSSDILGDLVRECRDGLDHADEAHAPVLADLETLVARDDALAKEEIDFEPTRLSLDLDFGATDAEPRAGAPEAAGSGDLRRVDTSGGGASLRVESPQTAVFDEADPDERGHRIRFKPDAALYAHGIEPLFLFRALREFGPVEVLCREHDLPGLESLECEQSHIGWELTLKCAEPEASIREVFDFVEGRCLLEIEASTANDPDPAVTDLPTFALPDERVQTPETPRAPHPLLAPEVERETPLDISGNSTDTAKPRNPENASGPKARVTPEASATPGPAARLTPRATVRVDPDRVDRLMNLVGEIVINQAMLTQSVEAAGLPPNSPVRTGLDELFQLTRDVQESVMMIRAQPVKSLFQRMSRIVRKASADLGKEVRLKVEGEHTEVDKTVIDRLADPLTHMIRNAVDHGLETGDDRDAAGKPRQGNVTLSARPRSGRIVIEVGDDGAGIDREKVLQKAIDRGLAPANAQLTAAEIDNFLFVPGLTTAPTVSNLSGRGVGMDVVRSAIQALGGRIAITSEPGRGSTFSISLPLTLAVLDGMVVRVAGETLVVPLNTILETLAVPEDSVQALGPDTHVVSIREQIVPLLDLGAELGYRDPLGRYSGSVVLLIGQEDGPAAALAIDAIEDQRQVVIKGLHESCGRIRGIAAATILGNGQVALILDPIDLMTAANGRTRRAGPANDLPIQTEQLKEIRA